MVPRWRHSWLTFHISLLHVSRVHINISRQARKAITEGSDSVHVELKLLCFAVYISHWMHVMFDITPVREVCVCVWVQLHTYTDELLGVAALGLQ